MRQLQTTDTEKVLMLDIIIDGIIHEYTDLPPVEKDYKSRAEKIGYTILTELETNGFITNAGIEGKKKS
jgi:hypothetical protein